MKRHYRRRRIHGSYLVIVDLGHPTSFTTYPGCSALRFGDIVFPLLLPLQMSLNESTVSIDLFLDFLRPHLLNFYLRFEVQPDSDLLQRWRRSPQSPRLLRLCKPAFGFHARPWQCNALTPPANLARTRLLMFITSSAEMPLMLLWPVMLALGLLALPARWLKISQIIGLLIWCALTFPSLNPLVSLPHLIWHLLWH